MSKDRAAPFSRKHRKYWIPVTGGMIVIGIINVAIGFCTYTPPTTPTRIVPNVPNVGDSPGDAAPPRAVPCAAAAAVQAQVPGTITACDATPTGYTVALVRADGRRVDLALTGDQIDTVAESLLLPEIPAPVMRAFAVAFPKTIPAGATKRSARGVEPVYEIRFPPGRDHALATLRPDGTILSTQ